MRRNMITTLGGAFSFTPEEREMLNEIERLRRRQAAWREAWVLADTRMGELRAKMQERLGRRGIDYASVCSDANRRTRVRLCRPMLTGPSSFEVVEVPYA